MWLNSKLFCLRGSTSNWSHFNLSPRTLVVKALAMFCFPYQFSISLHVDKVSCTASYRESEDMCAPLNSAGLSPAKAPVMWDSRDLYIPLATQFKRIEWSCSALQDNSCLQLQQAGRNPDNLIHTTNRLSDFARRCYLTVQQESAFFTYTFSPVGLVPLIEHNCKMNITATMDQLLGCCQSVCVGVKTCLRSIQCFFFFVWFIRMKMVLMMAPWISDKVCFKF